jgi:opacity protein-like surface antigen
MTLPRVCALAGAAVSAVVLAVSAVPAVAADLGYGSIKDVAPAPVSSRAWYLKGTIGVKNEDADSIWTSGGGTNGPGYQSGDFVVGGIDIERKAIFGLGVGVEYNRWLRLDVTGEYRGKQGFRARDFNWNLNYTNDYSADLESWLGLFNVYWDIRTWHGFTPYIGAGIGFSSNTVKDFTDVNTNNVAVYTGDKDKTTTNFAWALYAGVSYDLTPNLTFDAAYRYADLGDAKTGRASDGVGGWYTGLEIQDITSHDVLFSLRYRFDSPRSYPVALK